ncbi:MAG: serine hydrolase domain-containing protein [Bacillota bacterium]
MTTGHWTAFEEFTRGIMTEYHVAGTAVAVAQDGKIAYARGFGLRSLEPPLPVTPETVFGIASVTKSFTALAIMDLAGQGKLEPEDPVKEHLPDFAVPGHGDIRIHHLLSHTAGIPPLRRRQELAGFCEHLNYLATARYRLLGQPGRYLSYCNDAFLVLGAVIERVTGRPYREYVKETILDRLAMSRSTFSLSELEGLDNVTCLYLYDPAEGVLKQQPWPELGNYDVGGGIRSTVLDLVKYGGAYTGQ